MSPKRNTSVFRHDSPLFRMTGYLPILPMMFRRRPRPCCMAATSPRCIAIRTRRLPADVDDGAARGRWKRRRRSSGRSATVRSVSRDRISSAPGAATTTAATGRNAGRSPGGGYRSCARQASAHAAMRGRTSHHTDQQQTMAAMLRRRYRHANVMRTSATCSMSWTRR